MFRPGYKMNTTADCPFIDQILRSLIADADNVLQYVVQSVPTETYDG